MLMPTLKKAATDLWDELLALVVFNVLCVISLGLLPLAPFALFGLFFTVYDIGQGKAIKLSRFFDYARQTWRLAAVWGGVNLIVGLVLLANLLFYTGIEAQWAVVVRLLILGVIIAWSILQLISLAIYPRLLEPTFPLALRNAAVVMGLSPVSVILLTACIIVLILLSALIPPVFFLIALAALAVLTNRIVEQVVKRELEA